MTKEERQEAGSAGDRTLDAIRDVLSAPLSLYGAERPVMGPPVQTPGRGPASAAGLRRGACSQVLEAQSHPESQTQPTCASNGLQHMAGRKGKPPGHPPMRFHPQLCPLLQPFL